MAGLYLYPLIRKKQKRADPKKEYLLFKAKSNFFDQDFPPSPGRDMCSSRP